VETPETGYLLSNKLYNFLKNVVLVLLPAIGALYAALAPLWGLPSSAAVVGTCAAVAVFLGVVVKIGDLTYNKSEARYDGTLTVNPNPDGSGMVNVDLAKLMANNSPNEIASNKNEVILKVDNSTP
jgi:hypothetical protein